MAFTGEVSLLIAAPMLQDYLVDKTLGTPLAGGTVTLFRDKSREIYKNWYYQTGSPGSYTYVELDNPLTLSSVGTITDPNGNDVIPFYYPWKKNDITGAIEADPYFIKVKDSNELLQFTRENFPLVDSNTNANVTNTNKNYIVNNVFWRNIGTYPANGSVVPVTVTNGTVLAPSQHDGFSMPDIQFIRDEASGTDIVNFTQFPPNQFLDQVNGTNQNVTPEYYLNLNCTAGGTSVKQKCVQIPISLHVKNLEKTKASCSIWARSNPAAQITVKLLQFLGTGVSSSEPAVISTISNLSTIWKQYKFDFTFTAMPSTANISNTGDDAFYLQICYPTTGTFSIDIAKPAIYLVSDPKDIPDNDFDDYSQVDAIITTPKTGDVINTISSATRLGWVPMNDGTIGFTGSGATTRANVDTWPLYNLLWSLPVTACQSLAASSTGPYIARGASAYADFTGNVQLTLPKALGRVLAGANPSGVGIKQFVTASSGAGDLVITIDTPSGDTSGLYLGTQVTFVSTATLPTNLAAATQYWITPTGVQPSQTFKVSATLADALKETPVYIQNGVSAGTGTISFTTTVSTHTLASYLGQDTHSLSINELVSHNHSAPGGFVFNSGGAGPFTIGVSGNTGTVTNNTGGGNPFNVIQPTTYTNIFIKL